METITEDDRTLIMAHLGEMKTNVNVKTTKFPRHGMNKGFLIIIFLILIIDPDYYFI